jgi:GMP synthase (glutamine-hydrolysing)
MKLRLLVIDGYSRQGRAELTAGGARVASALYAETLRRIAGKENLILHTLFAADADASLPAGTALADFDGIVWTGSSLTIHSGQPEVTRQIALARAAFAAGVPQFGSCWAIQIAAMAAGGDCGPNPRGREMGLARNIAPTGAGRGHPLLRGRPGAYDAWAVHDDMVTRLPPGAVCLAGNAFTPVQAMAVCHGPGEFWAVQYHPEFDGHEIATLYELRAERLVRQGLAPDTAAVRALAARFRRLQDSPGDPWLRHELGADDQVLDFHLRTLEIRNWLKAQAWPRCFSRLGPPVAPVAREG